MRNGNRQARVVPLAIALLALTSGCARTTGRTALRDAAAPRAATIDPNMRVRLAAIDAMEWLRLR